MISVGCKYLLRQYYYAWDAMVGHTASYRYSGEKHALQQWRIDVALKIGFDYFASIYKATLLCHLPYDNKPLYYCIVTAFSLPLYQYTFLHKALISSLFLGETAIDMPLRLIIIVSYIWTSKKQEMSVRGPEPSQDIASLFLIFITS